MVPGLQGLQGLPLRESLATEVSSYDLPKPSIRSRRMEGFMLGCFMLSPVGNVLLLLPAPSGPEVEQEQEQEQVPSRSSADILNRR